MLKLLYTYSSDSCPQLWDLHLGFHSCISLFRPVLKIVDQDEGRHLFYGRLADISVYRCFYSSVAKKWRQRIHRLNGLKNEAYIPSYNVVFKSTIKKNENLQDKWMDLEVIMSRPPRL